MRVTYSGITATLALTIAISTGGAYAAGELLAKNSVTSKTIKNGQVKGKDLATNAIKSKKVAPNALKGLDIDESSLERVPVAGAADRAIQADRATEADRARQADRATSAVRADSAASADRATNILVASVENRAAPGSPPTLEASRSVGATNVVASPDVAFGAVLVSFDRSVSDCAMLASGDDRNVRSIVTASVNRAAFSGLPANVVEVGTERGGAVADASFTLVAYC